MKPVTTIIHATVIHSIFLIFGYMRRFICMILILTVTSFALEIILPLLEDQQTEQLASLSDNDDEDDSDDKNENEQEDVKDDLFFEVTEDSINFLLADTKKAGFSVYLFPPATSHTEIPFCPPEMML